MKLDKFDKFVVGLGLSIALAAPSAASAQMPPGKIGYARTIGTVRIDNGGKQALVALNYSCKSGNHLWVSLKQSASGRRDNRIKNEGSGGGKVAATWLDSHREVAVCDGRKRSAQFYVDKQEPGKYGKLRNGWAWLQFCVTNETDPNNPESSEVTTYLPKWVRTF